MMSTAQKRTSDRPQLGGKVHDHLAASGLSDMVISTIACRGLVRTLAVLALLVTGLFSVGSLAQMQAAPSAAKIAGQVQAFYDQTRSVEASFDQTYFHKLYRRYDRSRGTLRILKPGRMRWDYAEPNGKVLVADGKRLRVFEPGEDGAPGQIIERSLKGAQLPDALSFLTGGARLESLFEMRLLDARKQGYEAGHVLELRPLQPSSHYDRILFYVDAHPDRLGLVHRVMIIDAAGNRNRFDFKKMRFNRKIGQRVFAYEPPPGTRSVRP